jgi:[ribosomal protein S5]-alanine N-acetyltransferase
LIPYGKWRDKFKLNKFFEGLRKMVKIIKLETPRLILRKPKKEDIEEVYNLINEKSIFKNFFTPYPYKKKHTTDFVNYWIKDWGKRSYWIVLELKKTGEIVGVAGIREIDKTNKTAQVHSWIGKNFRRKGYAKEAKIAIFDFAFYHLKLRKLISEVASYNKESISMQNKFGMVWEGTKRKENFNPFLKRFVDMNIYGLFEKEWNKVSKKLKKELFLKNKDCKD